MIIRIRLQGINIKMLKNPFFKTTICIMWVFVYSVYLLFDIMYSCLKFLYFALSV